MNFLEAQQQIKTNITEAMYTLFGEGVGEITANFDTANSLVMAKIQLEPRISYEFVYNMNTEELQCVTTGVSIKEDNNVTMITAIPMTMSLHIMERVKEAFEEQLSITLDMASNDAEPEASVAAAQEE